ncbi:MAG: transketolase C-terminal domain-containing protein, partial [bacterium]|nr:transketolase C-terminal domain-containing protein [bacterium]
YLSPVELENHNIHLQKKYDMIRSLEQKAELYRCSDADIIIAAYGSTARIAKSAIEQLRHMGIKAGLIRPISLWPFPIKFFEQIVHIPKCFLTIEMSAGQMVEDVRLAVAARAPVHFYGRTGGMIPSVEEIVSKVIEITGGNSND